MSSSSSSSDESSSSSNFSSHSSPVLKVKTTENMQVRVFHVECEMERHIGRLVKGGVNVNFMTLLAPKKPMKEPEIIYWIFKNQLTMAVLKVNPIGNGQSRFKVYAAVCDGAGYAGIGSSCGRTEAATTASAVKNAKQCLHQVPRSISKPIEGQFANCWVRMDECSEVVAEPLPKKN